MAQMFRKSPEALAGIKVLIFDVDGVLTTGDLFIGPNGEEFKVFNSKDGAGIKYWMRVGHRAAIITGRTSDAVKFRAEELGFDFLAMGAKNKLPEMQKLVEELNCSPEECAYMGDDLPDIPAMRFCGVSIAPADAVAEVLEFADIVTDLPGGCGAAREAIEFILHAQGKWSEIMERYK